MPDPDLPPELLRKLSSLDLSKPEDVDRLFALEAELGAATGLASTGDPGPDAGDPEVEPTPAYFAATDPRADLATFRRLVGDDLHQTVAGQTLLFPACLGGSLEKAAWLLQQGVDPNARDPDGYTALLYACLPGKWADPALLQLLLDHGADPDAASCHGETPLRILVREGNYQDVFLILSEGQDHPDFPLLHQAACCGDLAELQRHLSPETLEQRNHWQRTPWLTALHAEQTGIARFLESQGADTTAVGHMGDTALHLAAEGNASLSVRYLLSKDLPVDPRAPHGNTPLHNAVESDALGTALLLLEAGADVHARTTEGDTPMAFADSAAMVRLLCDHGADPNQPDSRGVRPLEHFAECEDVDGILTLFDRGADHTAIPAETYRFIKTLLSTP